MRTWLLGAAIAVALVGCGGGDPGDDTDAGGSPVDGGPGIDGGTSDEDGGTSDEDGGTSDEDGGASDEDGGSDDGGTSEEDGGTSEGDAGTSEEDGGTSEQDAGSPEDGGGLVIVDSGVSRLDGGALGCGRCTREQYCATPDGMCDVAGACLPRPDACLGVFMPVCGCDGRTYSNACTAHRAGQSVAFDGECPPIADCRTEGCARGETCEPCRGAGYVCLPVGTVC